MPSFQAIIWLERYLQGWPSTLLVVSHDRNFLEEVPTDMLHVHTQASINSTFKVVHILIRVANDHGHDHIF